MILFDTATLTDWKTRGVTDISCFLIEAGCAGEKIQVIEGIAAGMDVSFLIGEMKVHLRGGEVDFFRDIRITHVGARWIVSGDTINVHCGCGSSFSRKTGNPILDKARLMKEKIRQKKEKSHE